MGAHNRRLAGWTLGAAAAGLLAALPWQAHFWGGLAASGCSAALVGGLADWFAVEALFRRPLGIRYRTAIIPRNRERIFQAMAHMVQDELLMKENILQRLAGYDWLTLASRGWQSPGGRQALKQLVYRVLKDALQACDAATLSRLLQGLGRAAHDVNWTQHGLRLAAWLLERGHFERLLDLLLRQAIAWSEQPAVAMAIANWLEAAQTRYERGLERRRFLHQLLDVSSEEMAAMAVRVIRERLTAWLQPEDGQRAAAKARLLAWLRAKEADAAFCAAGNQWLHKQSEVWQLADTLAAYGATVLQATAQKPRLLLTTAEQLLAAVEAWSAAAPAGLREQGNAWVLATLGRQLDAHHAEIGRLVLASLERFSDAKLVAFIEDKVGNDLQMIRMNGSLVGGCAGMLLYVLTAWLP